MIEQESRTISRTDWLLIGVLLALVLPLRLWLLHNTEVTARDSIGYIRYALQFERMPWQEVWEKNHQHPGYPMSVWMMSLPIRAIDGETTPENMERSTQLVNLFASLLLMLPMYFLGRQFFDRTVSFGGTLLYQILPISAQHLSDGISEPIYLVWLVSGLWQMVMAIRDRRIGNCVLCGFCTGMAYLTRPEGLLIVPAFGLALLAMQFRPEWRSTYRRFLACGAAMVLTAMLVGSVYVYATGRITNKLSAVEIYTYMKKSFAPAPEANAGSMILLAETFVLSDSKAARVQQAVSAYVKEISQGLHYVGVVPALLGVWWSFGSLRRQPGFWALPIYGVIHSTILIALAMSVGYVSDRHVMILVLGASFFVVLGLRELPRHVLGWLKMNANIVTERWYRSAPVWFAVLFIGMIGSCLPKATQRLHANRAGNHEAGRWLSDHVKPGDVVVDDHAWSVFFSGLLFQEGREPAPAKGYEPLCYVVTTRSRDADIDKQRASVLDTKKAEVVFAWPDKTDPRVVVYAQMRDRKIHPWRIER